MRNLSVFLCCRFRWDLRLCGEDSHVLCRSDYHGDCCHQCAPHGEEKEAKINLSNVYKAQSYVENFCACLFVFSLVAALVKK